MISWQEQIEEDLDWREAELATLKKAVAEAPPGTVRKRVLLRALWAMLYAHYEGFCKFAWDLFLEVIEKQDVERFNCKSGVAQFSLEKAFRKLRKDLSSSSVWEFCSDGFMKAMSEPARFPIKLETNSNLWPSLCRENNSRIGIPCTMIDANSTIINALVSRRNDIAHGKRMTVSSLTEYQQYEDAAFAVMYELALSVVESSDQKLYLRSLETDRNHED